VRALLLEMPQLLRGILEQAIETHGDCELLKATRRAFPTALEPAIAPDVVILGLTAAEDATLVPALFARWPLAQVMTVTQAGDDVALYDWRPRRRSLGQMSPEQIVSMLCNSARRDRETAP